jgi:4-amino-4-deoxy-L-arabinose transferase-like glycosyltransferase
MIAPLKLFALSPVGPAVQVALLGILTVALVWWIGRQWFGRVPALAVALLYAVSPTVINYSRSSWNPNIMPFFALISMYGIWKIWRLGYLRWMVISGISFAFVLNSHYLGLLLAPVIGLFWFLSRHRPGWKKYSLITAFSFLLLMSPLFFFDLRHNWINSGAVYDFFSRRQTTVNLKIHKAIPNIWPVFTEINTTLLAAKDKSIGSLISWFIVISIGTCLIPGTIKNSRRDLVFVLTWMGLGLLGLGLYKQHIYDHYFGFLFPVPFFLLGFSLSLLFQKPISKILGVVLIIFLAIFSLSKSPLLSFPNLQLAHTREISDFIKTESHDQPFNLALVSKNNYDSAYRYFLDLNSAPFRTIHDQITEQLFVICEGAECNPIGHPLWEIASFGWAKIDREWEFPWGVKLYRLVHNPTGR